MGISGPLSVRLPSNRLCRHFLRNLKWIRPISGAKNWRHSLPSAARVRPASAPFPYSASLRTPTGATTNDLTPCRMPLVLSPPPLTLRLRQNKRPYGYAGVVVHRSSAAAPSTSMYSFAEKTPPWRAERSNPDSLPNGIYNNPPRWPNPGLPRRSPSYS